MKSSSSQKPWLKISMHGNKLVECTRLLVPDPTQIPKAPKQTKKKKEKQNHNKQAHRCGRALYIHVAPSHTWQNHFVNIVLFEASTQVLNPGNKSLIEIVVVVVVASQVAFLFKLTRYSIDPHSISHSLSLSLSLTLFLDHPWTDTNYYSSYSSSQETLSSLFPQNHAHSHRGPKVKESFLLQVLLLLLLLVLLPLLLLAPPFFFSFSFFFFLVENCCSCCRNCYTNDDDDDAKWALVWLENGGISRASCLAAAIAVHTTLLLLLLLWL